MVGAGLPTTIWWSINLTGLSKTQYIKDQNTIHQESKDFKYQDIISLGFRALGFLLIDQDQKCNRSRTENHTTQCTCQLAELNVKQRKPTTYTSYCGFTNLGQKLNNHMIELHKRDQILFDQIIDQDQIHPYSSYTVKYNNFPLVESLSKSMIILNGKNSITLQIFQTFIFLSELFS
uniref:Uncharacterized protein n=1 Tax=Rhizophagus irregularis (strain DAOM 181602 / DAOM 197198 / MUCL 43194) TaxID=747089 RepID=U9UKV2_RHIID